jgi:hypothetical protein
MSGPLNPLQLKNFKYNEFLDLMLYSIDASAVLYGLK